MLIILDCKFHPFFAKQSLHFVKLFLEMRPEKPSISYAVFHMVKSVCDGTNL